MNKDTFLHILEKNLTAFDKIEKQEIMHDFYEYFAEALARGESERDISQKLGNPEQIAKELMCERGIEIEENSVSNQTSLLHVIGTTVGLIFLNITFMLGIVASIVGLLGGLYIMSVVFVLSPFIFLFETIQLETFNPFQFFSTITLVGVGILILLALIPATKFFVKLFKKYIKWNIRIVKGGH